MTVADIIDLPTPTHARLSVFGIAETLEEIGFSRAEAASWLRDVADEVASPAPPGFLEKSRELRRIIEDPRFWRDRDPAFIDKAAEELRRLSDG